MMKSTLSIFLMSLVLSFAATRTNQMASAQDATVKPTPIKVLLVAGGCCHDYATQTKLLKEGIEARIVADVSIVYNPSTGTDTRFDIYEADDWADGYDVVIHDECSASVTEKPYVNRILAAHRNGVPAVNLHCAMHSYRWGDYRQPVQDGGDNSMWYEMLGIQSTSHGAQAPIAVSYSKSGNPITKGLDDWTTINEELYNNVRVFDGAEVLATGKQVTPPNKGELRKNPEAKAKDSTAVVAWTNHYGPKQTRIFSTTLGHNNNTVGDARYLDLVAQGLLWTTGKLSPQGRATAGFAK